MAAVTKAVAAGHITPSEAAEIAKVIDAYVKAYQTAELDERVARVEQLMGRRTARHETQRHDNKIVDIALRALITAINNRSLLPTSSALDRQRPHRMCKLGRWNVDPDQARMPVGQKSVDGCPGSRVGAAHRRSKPADVRQSRSSRPSDDGRGR